MGLFSSLFGKRQNDKPLVSNATGMLNATIRSNTQTAASEAHPVLHLKGKTDKNGLYPSELVMLSVAEKYKVSETNYPGYLTYTYEVANPGKTLRDLQSRGFLREGDPADSLPQFKVAELKQIASSLGVAVKGKKADIIAALSETDEEMLGEYVKERTWKLTESGRTAIEDNPYIQYFLDRHEYAVSEVGVDIWTVNKEFVKNPNRPYRDIIFNQLNEHMFKAAIELQKDPSAGNGTSYKYCECYRIMGLFIEEEGKSYVNAADYYFQYLFKRINIHGGLQLARTYILFKGNKKYQDEAIDHYYNDICLYPFHRTEILRLIDELGLKGEEVSNALIASFKRAKDTGVMTEREAADFIILELSGDVDQSRELAGKLARKTMKKIR